MRGKLKVTTWVQHFIDSHPLCSMSIIPPIPEIQHFQNLTLKIQGQGHGWWERWKSQSGCNILSTHIPSIPHQSAIPFLKYNFFKIWPWKSKVKVMGEGNVESHKVGVASYRLTSHSMSIGPSIPEIQHFQTLTLKIQGQGHGWGGHWNSQYGSNILSTHIPLILCQSAIPFLSYDFFKIWTWKSKVKVMGQGNVKSHKVGVASYWLTPLPFHVNLPFHSWDTAFWKFDLENPRSRSNDHDVAQLEV